MFGDAVGWLRSPGGVVPVHSLRHACHLRVVRARVVVLLRAAVQLLALALVPVLACAQAPATVPRVGVLLFDPAPSGGNPDPVQGGLQRGLREFGYVEGRNVMFDRRYADGRPERLPALAAELVRLKVDLILTGGPATREAASQATRVIPIVAVSGSDPVREGWAESLARPGGNVTGLTVTFPELDSKRLQLLKDAFPTLERLAGPSQV